MLARDEVPIQIHPNTASGIVVVNYPGRRGDINGYNNKYVTLAEFLRTKVGAVVRMGNRESADIPYPQSVQDDLRRVIDAVIDRSDEICGASKPTVYLMGFSAGASAIAAVCSQYPAVTKLLLCAPSGNAGGAAMVAGLGAFTGEVSVLGAANDAVVGPNAAISVADLATRASIKRVEVLPDCDHRFSGRRNGLILSKAPLWAFAGDTDFPSTSGGIALY
jgi:pimeloyl-ACP methyl ester carboxylesterase